MMPRIQTAASRGERLYPARSSRSYWLLTSLRKAMEAAIAEHLNKNRKYSLIDYGCGNMPYKPLFPPCVESYIGCDFTGNEMADEALHDDGVLPSCASSVEIVLSSQVLEHVIDPQLYLSECHRVLNQSGLLYLSTHGLYRFHPDPTDFWRWTSAGLRKEVEDAGFSVDYFVGVLGPAATALKLLQDANLPRTPKRLRALYRFYMQRRIRAADLKCSNGIRNKDACVYLLVARKRSV